MDGQHVNWRDVATALNLNFERGGRQARGRCVNHASASGNSMVVWGGDRGEALFVCHARCANLRELALLAEEKTGLKILTSRDDDTFSSFNSKLFPVSKSQNKLRNISSIDYKQKYSLNYIRSLRRWMLAELPDKKPASRVRDDNNNFINFSHTVSSTWKTYEWCKNKSDNATKRQLVPSFCYLPTKESALPLIFFDIDYHPELDDDNKTGLAIRDDFFLHLDNHNVPCFWSQSGNGIHGLAVMKPEQEEDWKFLGEHKLEPLDPVIVREKDKDGNDVDVKKPIIKLEIWPSWEGRHIILTGQSIHDEYDFSDTEFPEFNINDLLEMPGGDYVEYEIAKEKDSYENQILQWGRGEIKKIQSRRETDPKMLLTPYGGMSRVIYYCFPYIRMRYTEENRVQILWWHDKSSSWSTDLALFRLYIKMATDMFLFDLDIRLPELAPAYRYELFERETDITFKQIYDWISTDVADNTDTKDAPDSEKEKNDKYLDISSSIEWNNRKVYPVLPFMTGLWNWKERRWLTREEAMNCMIDDTLKKISTDLDLESYKKDTAGAIFARKMVGHWGIAIPQIAYALQSPHKAITFFIGNTNTAKTLLTSTLKTILGHACTFKSVDDLKGNNNFTQLEGDMCKSLLVIVTEASLDDREYKDGQKKRSYIETSRFNRSTGENFYNVNLKFKIQADMLRTANVITAGNETPPVDCSNPAVQTRLIPQFWGDEMQIRLDPEEQILVESPEFKNALFAIIIDLMAEIPDTYDIPEEITNIHTDSIKDFLKEMETNEKNDYIDFKQWYETTPATNIDLIYPSELYEHIKTVTNTFLSRNKITRQFKKAMGIRQGQIQRNPETGKTEAPFLGVIKLSDDEADAYAAQTEADKPQELSEVRPLFQDPSCWTLLLNKYIQEDCEMCEQLGRIPGHTLCKSCYLDLQDDIDVNNNGDLDW